MYLFLATLVVLHTILSVAVSQKCNVYCPPGEGQTICGLNQKLRKYFLFPSECALKAYTICNNIKIVKTPLKFCINDQIARTRRMYGESCPTFCPSHYRPVCGMSKLRAYIYKTFNNGCYFDMLNCRGDSDLDGYIEVPLSFCQRHLMKNIFKEKVLFTGFNDYRDYHEY